ncbi:MAG: alpha/beta fold hydrolase [Candidatus Hodarchaeales archaeon]|jgi:dipeptidyl aminopeptidase/acylaminoacyl peptidase
MHKNSFDLPELIPLEILFGNPDKIQPRISPDGKKIAYIAPLEGVLNVWIQDIKRKIDAIPITKDKERGIQTFIWGYNQENPQIYYVQDKGGNENWLLYSVDLKTEEIKCMTPYENVQVQIIDRNKHYPNDLIIAMNIKNPELHDIYHLNLLTGEITQREKNPGGITEWITDFDLQVRGALKALPEGAFELIIRETEESDWRHLYSWNAENSGNSGPLIFSKDGQTIYLLDSTGVNANCLVKMDLATGEKKVIINDPELKFDISSIMIHPDSLEIQLVTFTKARDEHVILDESIKEDISTIQAFHQGEFFLGNRDFADKMWLVGYSSDTGPVPYYIYNRDLKEFSFLFEHQPKLNDYSLAPMEPISYLARDGLEIHGYITFPLGLPRKNLPLLLIVHGGPWSRDYWGFDSEVQLFSNRGYVCLQVNFRGSTGYGKAFVNAGNKEWGGKMHEDLLDGVEWAIKQDFADPNKISIYGGSYGGYAALTGATVTPSVFCCAVDLVGISNLLTFLHSIPPYWKNYLDELYKRVGNPETEEEFLKSRSPLYKVENIKIPILIAQGANDPRVKQAESEQIVEAMEKKSIEYEYLLFPDEGHGLIIPENRLKFYRKMEEFLSKHLGGRNENFDSNIN